MFEFLKKDSVEIEDKEIQEDFSDIESVAHYFKNETGVTFETQFSILQNKVSIFCKKRDINSFKRLLEIVKKDSLIKQELIDYLTTNETFFYREYSQIEELVKLVELAVGRVDILCAPCATGEEPYSIAIALLESNIPSSRFDIVAIDINDEALQKAKIGLYKERNVRNLSKEILQRYFFPQDNIYKIKDEIKSKVTFKKFNIFDKNLSTLGKFDFIFSRNMLIYFDQETKIKAKTILESLRKNDKHEIFFGHADFFE
jgi:chemotaxis protein methyltransferase CheR